jgi:translation elongation factor EF-1beta
MSPSINIDESTIQHLNQEPISNNIRNMATNLIFNDDGTSIENQLTTLINWVSGVQTIHINNYGMLYSFHGEQYVFTNFETPLRDVVISGIASVDNGIGNVQVIMRVIDL